MHREIRRAAASFIEAHLDLPLTLDDIARAALTSRRQLQRVFAADGLTVRAYIAVARMRRASELLVDSDIPLPEVAAAVGFGHVSAFVRAFHRHYGATPIAWRRRHL